MLSTSSLWDFIDNNLSFNMPQTRVQQLRNFLCNRKNKVTEFVSVPVSGSEGVKLAKNTKNVRITCDTTFKGFLGSRKQMKMLDW